MNTIANTDVPNDNNACTTDTCSAGTPTYTNVAINTACGTGDFCNGAGSCVDCNNASQCGTSTFCQTFTCNSNTCGVSNTANGTALPVGMQVSGNCRELRCNGVGGTTNAVLDSDVPVDGNQCTNDVCTSGTPSNPNSAINTACGSGDFCNGSGTCVDCTTATQCPNGNQCQSRTCTGNSCGLNNLVGGRPATTGLFCTLTDTCNGSGTCGGTGGPCNSQCQTCNDTSDVCVNRSNGFTCTDNAFCTSGDSCQGGACSPGGGSPCDSQCETCNESGDSCPNISAGTACSTPAGGRNNVCHVAQCDGGGTCGYRVNRFPGGSMTAGNQPASYPTPTATTFSTCLGCHGTGSTYGAFSFDEAWSESSDYAIFDSYCANWNLAPDVQLLRRSAWRLPAAPRGPREHAAGLAGDLDLPGRVPAVVLQQQRPGRRPLRVLTADG
jgi:hypothetical protein